MLDLADVSEVRSIAVDPAICRVRLLVHFAHGRCKLNASIFEGLGLRPYAREKLDNLQRHCDSSTKSLMNV